MQKRIVFVYVAVALLSQVARAGGILPPAKPSDDSAKLEIIDPVGTQLPIEDLAPTRADVATAVEAEAEAKVTDAAQMPQTTQTTQAAQTPTVEKTSDAKAGEIKIFKGGIDPVICSKEGHVLIRDESLAEVLFKVERFDAVKVFQGWGENKKQKEVDGKTYEFVKVQIPDYEDEAHDGIGWVAAEFIQPKADCKGADKAEALKVAELEKSLQSRGKKKITGLTDSACCGFPLKGRPSNSFLTGAAQFGAGRAGGRIHAACDLYRNRLDPIVAVAPGKVLRGPYYFYQGTYAIEVLHPGGFVVRYGEVNGKQARNVAEGRPVAMGQTIGYMGKVNSNCCSPMLHFEMYSGKKRGPLTQYTNRFQRRSDLVNPSKYLLRWEHDAF